MEVGFRSKVTVAPTYFKYKQSGPVTDQMYRDTMENVASYNSRLCHERRLRLPFLDSQTGVAQNHSNLWMGYRYRSPGVTQGQLYTYPAKRWRKKKRLYSQLEMTKAGDIETGEADMHAISAVENPAALITQLEPDLKEQVPHTDILYKDIWYDEMDAISEPPDAGEIENRNSDSSDYEETYIKRRRKKNKTKSTGRGRGKKSGDHGKDDLPLDKEKPYVCDTCGARYKTRPGLNYHLNHNHDGAFASTSDDTRSQSPTIPSLPPTGLSLFNTEKPPPGPSTSASAKNISANNYCDFCLGDADKNMKTGVQEELVSCADCGRSGHPTCLQFTANMIISVKKYPWQCIECKSCGLCGTSDNDDQLLFCDDCDRGYHMYCLNPPLSEPPEGSWSCHLCIAEFHGGKLPESMKAP